MHPALLAGVPLNGSLLVDNVKLVRVGGNAYVFARHDAHNGKERPRWFPAFGASAGVIVRDVAGEGYLDFLAGTLAEEVASWEGGRAFGEAVVEKGVERRHFFLFCLFACASLIVFIVFLSLPQAWWMLRILR